MHFIDDKCGFGESKLFSSKVRQQSAVMNVSKQTKNTGVYRLPRLKLALTSALGFDFRSYDGMNIHFSIFLLRKQPRIFILIFLILDVV